mmetsp:Transcript_28792/g.40481  ORF Transcript_28792/g.40481 Transcript_28792/m.40481 type:complete len:590 (-) Transcript_28792:1954-3723(-)
MNNFDIAIFVCLLCYGSVIGFEHEHSSTYFRGLKNTNERRCRLYWLYTETGHGDEETLECEILLKGRVRRLELQGLSEEWLAKNKGNIVSSESELEAPKMEIDTNSTIEGRDPFAFNVQNLIVSDDSIVVQRSEVHEEEERYQRRLESRTMGKKEAIVLRVGTTDSKPPLDAKELSNQVFGTYIDSQNVQSRMDACSYGQLNISPSNAIGIDGVYDINLDLTTSENDKYGRAVVNAALDQLRTQVGDDLTKKFDHIMICVPSGVKPFIGYAWRNDFLSVYYDSWCGSLTTKMHEIGHNMGLIHSGEGDCPRCGHADYSGLMGQVYPEADGPIMCFNGPKSWQLGWYKAKHVSVNPLEQDWEGQIVGIADYGAILNSPNYHVIVELPSPKRNLAYYISLNRKAGINSDTKEGGDQVMITTQFTQKGDGGASNLEAKLNSNGEYYITDFDKSGQNVMITVNSISMTDSLLVADVSIVRQRVSLELDPQPKPPTHRPTSRPTSRPTPRPTSRPTASPVGKSSGDMFSGLRIKPDAAYSSPSYCESFGSVAECSKERRRCIWDDKKDSCLKKFKRVKKSKSRKNAGRIRSAKR